MILIWFILVIHFFFFRRGRTKKKKGLMGGAVALECRALDFGNLGVKVQILAFSSCYLVLEILSHLFGQVNLDFSDSLKTKFFHSF